MNLFAGKALNFTRRGCRAGGATASRRTRIRHYRSRVGGATAPHDVALPAMLIAVNQALAAEYWAIGRDTNWSWRDGSGRSGRVGGGACAAVRSRG